MVKPVSRDGVLTPVCPYCGVEGVLRHLPNSNGRGMFRRWECPMPGCDARVGVHRDSKRGAPLGTMARATRREARTFAHADFDPLWKGGHFPSRNAAYAWLAEALGIPVERCHIAEFDEAQCFAVRLAVHRFMEVPR